jgi:hypothetical protein
MKKLVYVLTFLLLGLILSCSTSTKQHPNRYYVDRINVRLIDYLGEDTLLPGDMSKPFNWNSNNDLAGISVEFIQVFYADTNAKYARRYSGTIEPGQAGSKDSISKFLIAAIDTTGNSIILNDQVSPAKTYNSMTYTSIDDFVHEFNTNGSRTTGIKLRYPVIFLISKDQLKKFNELKTVIEIGKLKFTTTILLDDPVTYSY